MDYDANVIDDFWCRASLRYRSKGGRRAQLNIDIAGPVQKNEKADRAGAGSTICLRRPLRMPRGNDEWCAIISTPYFLPHQDPSKLVQSRVRINLAVSAGERRNPSLRCDMITATRQGEVAESFLDRFTRCHFLDLWAPSWHMKRYTNIYKRRAKWLLLYPCGACLESSLST